MSEQGREPRVTIERRYIFGGRAYQTKERAYCAAARKELFSQMQPVAIEDLARCEARPFDVSGLMDAVHKRAQEMMAEDGLDAQEQVALRAAQEEPSRE